MLSTKSLVSNIESVPKEWVFEYYLNLKEKLTGQNVKILSVFNSSDKIPSMFIYFDSNSGEYKFKDFSSGYYGGHIDLVTTMFSLPNYSQTVHKIISDYENYIKDNSVSPVVEYQMHDKFKVVDYEIRHWTNLDQEYWSGYKLGSKILEYYNVSPLEFFTMEKTELDGTVNSLTFNKKYLYGYFRNDGSLYKIYSPKNQEKKFIKVENYTQGADQLILSPTKVCDLVITSSLKDLMCFIKLGIPGMQAIAPDSENSMINSDTIFKIKSIFNKIIVLFDNDSPGIAAAQKYKEKYNFDYIVLDMEKDLSDSVKAHGLIKVKERLITLLDELDLSR